MSGVKPEAPGGTSRSPKNRKRQGPATPGLQRGFSVKVFRPRTMNGLLRLYHGNTDALLYAGGTEITPQLVRGRDRRLKLPEKVIYLGHVPDLLRITRAQRHLDIGACLTLSRILAIGRHIIPQVLRQTLSSVGNPAVRNLATLGGNICTAQNDSLAALSAIDAHLEVRSVAGSRWVRVDQFFRNPWRNILGRDEVLTRIRIPLEDWDFQLFRKVGRWSSPALVSFAGVARFGKGILEVFRYCFGGAGDFLFCSQGIGSRLEGGKLPVPARDIEGLLSDQAGRIPLPEGTSTPGSPPRRGPLGKARAPGSPTQHGPLGKIHAPSDPYPPTPVAPSQQAMARYQRETALRLLRAFIRDINRESG